MGKNYHANWPLVLGLLIVSLTLFIALLGPSLAPRNPLEEQRVIQQGDVWLSAPYPPFTVEGYPLGSDVWGRDVLSQMLWALRPTLMLVSVVALFRLGVGLLVGLFAGWDDGPLGRLFNALIGAALAIPTLIVALATVATLGYSFGPWGFVLGLSLTGWADSARMVRDQTRITRGQLFIEAGRAMGASNRRLLAGPVLRQILPFLWMLFTFEISSTLLLTAGLGFLGYYVGGEVWVWISDTVAARLSGMPELGQMLSGVSEDIYTGPWKMFAAGTLVFITVLGFNLLGEGLRRQASAGIRASALSEQLKFLYWKLEDERLTPLKKWMRANPVKAAGVVTLGLAALSTLVAPLWILTRPQPIIYPVPGGHLWGSRYHDPYGTLWAVQASPVENPQFAWKITAESGFSGGPAVSKDGVIYLGTTGGQVLAISSDGNLLWQANLPASAVGTPALDSEGNVYVADKLGGLTSFTSQGEQRWNLQPEGNYEATSSPVVGANNIIYTTVLGELWAVSTEGESLWRSRAFNRRVPHTPVLNPGEELVFLRGVVMTTADGIVQDYDSLPTIEQYFVGLDGRLHARFETQMFAWEYVDGEGQVLDRYRWHRTSFFGFTDLIGVLADQTVWVSFETTSEDARLLWLDQEGEMIETARFPYRPGVLIGMDEAYNFYMCGSTRSGSECSMVARGQPSATWSLQLEDSSAVTGGAIVSGRLYVATEEGVFYAIGD